MGAKQKGHRGCCCLVIVVLLVGILVMSLAVLKNSDFFASWTGKMQDVFLFEENTIDIQELEGRFYYDQLTEEEQLTYRELLQGMRAEQTEIYVHTADGERAMEIYQIILNDFPELFWCESSVSAQYAEEPNLLFQYSILSPVYLYTGAERAKREEQIEQSVHAYLAEILEGENDYEKIRQVYQRLIEQTDYSEEASDNQNIYSVFVNGESVCAGYARAFQYLMQRLDIPCIYVLGDAMDEQGETSAHAWNIVRCDGDYYNVDVTWGDPIYLGDEQAEQGERIYYDYLCCNDVELQDTHRKLAQYPYPDCTSNNYNYYVLADQYYQSYSSETVLERMKASIDRKSYDTVLKFETRALYEQALSEIRAGLQEEAALYLCELYELDGVQFSSEGNEMLRVIRLYWEYES